MLKILLPSWPQTHPSNDMSNCQLYSLLCYRKLVFNNYKFTRIPKTYMESHIALFRPILSPMGKLTMHPNKQQILYMDIGRSVLSSIIDSSLNTWYLIMSTKIPTIDFESFFNTVSGDRRSCHHGVQYWPLYWGQTLGCASDYQGRYWRCYYGRNRCLPLLVNPYRTAGRTDWEIHKRLLFHSTIYSWKIIESHVPWPPEKWRKYLLSLIIIFSLSSPRRE